MTYAERRARQLFPHLTDDELRRLFGGAAAPAADPAAPFFTAILCVSDLRRLSMVQTALRYYQAQTWPHRQLYLVNATPQPLLPPEASQQGLFEVATTPGGPAVLRNVALAKLERGPQHWAVCWDDDDCFHRDFLRRLASAAQPGHILALDSQLRVDLRTSWVYIAHDPAGLPATAAWPLESRWCFREDQPFGDEERLWRELDAPKTVLAASGNYLALARIALWHGGNAAPWSRFMAGYPDGPDGPANRWHMPTVLAEAAQAVLKERGIHVQPSQAPAPVAAAGHEEAAVPAAQLRRSTRQRSDGDAASAGTVRLGSLPLAAVPSTRRPA